MDPNGENWLGPKTVCCKNHGMYKNVEGISIRVKSENRKCMGK